MMKKRSGSLNGPLSLPFRFPIFHAGRHLVVLGTLAVVHVGALRVLHLAVLAGHAVETFAARAGVHELGVGSA